MPESSTTSAATSASNASESGSQPLLSPKNLERMARLRLGHEAVMLQDAQEALEMNRKTVAEHYRQNGLNLPADDMGTINLGDTTVYQTTPPAVTPAPATGLSALAKAGIITAGAAALGGGVGLPFALPAIIDALKPVVTPAPVTPVQPAPTIDTDTDTVFDLFIGGPKDAE